MNQMADNDLQSSVEKENSGVQYYVARKTHLLICSHWPRKGMEARARRGETGNHWRANYAEREDRISRCACVADRLHWLIIVL